MPNMVHEVFGDFILVLHTTTLPSDEEWGDYLDSIKKKMSIQVRQLVFTDGGGPNTKQRAALDEVLRGKINTGSVISSSRIIRHVVAAINWLGPHNVWSFAPNELDKALQHIGVTEQEAPKLLAKAATLATKLSSPLHSLPPNLQRSLRTP